MKRTILYFAVLLAAVIAIVAGARAAEWRAIDGDTIKAVEPIAGTKRVRTVRTVRLWGIDAPETGRLAKCQREIDLGLAATSEVARLLAEARRVRIDQRTGRDKYGRELAGVIVTQRSGARVDIGAHLLDLQLARQYLGHGPKPQWCPG